MILRRRKVLSSTCILLSFIVVSPSFFGISSVKSGPVLLRVQEENSRGWVTPTLGGHRESKLADRFVRIEVWTNGTKVHYASHIWLYEPECRDMWANFTSWIPQSTSQQANRSSSYFQPLSEGNLPTRQLDGDIWFIRGSNSTCSTSYEHDNNYEVYFPKQWDYPFDMEGLTKTHVHLTKSLVYSWWNGNLTTAQALVWSMLISFAVSGFLDALGYEELIVLLADSIDAPFIVILYATYELADLFWQWLQMLGYVMTSVWVYNELWEHYSGDGWAWRGPIDHWGCYICSDNSQVFYSSGPPQLYWRRLQRQIDYYDVASWQQSWGSEGVFCATPREYIISWYTRSEYKSPRTAIWT